MFQAGKKFTLAAVLFVAFFSSAPAKAQAVPCAAKAQSVPFTMRGGEIVVSVVVDGRDVEMILDTGAANTALDSGHVWLVSNHETMARSADGKSVGISIGRVRLTIAGRTFDTTVLVLPQKPLGASGLLGENVLVKFNRVTVDYKKREIIFE